MERETLKKKDVAERLTKEVFFLQLDGDAHTDTVRRYRILAFPTLCLLDPKGDHLVNVVGYMERKDFLRLLDYLKGGSYRTMSLEDYFQRKKQ